MALTPETIHLWADTLCLDYANSVVWSPANEHLDPAETDVLRTGDMFGRWGRRLDLLSRDAASPSDTELRRARALRDVVHRSFVAVSRNQEPSAQDRAALMRNYTEAVREASLLPGQPSFRLDWSQQDPRRVRYAVAHDALELLLDPDRLRRVSYCPGRSCGWLFLNASGRRRWCSMTTCGSREKMRRLYQRQQEAR